MKSVSKHVADWYNSKGREEFVSGGRISQKRVQKLSEFDPEKYRHLYEGQDWKALAKVLKSYGYLTCGTCGNASEKAKNWALTIYE